MSQTDLSLLVPPLGPMIRYAMVKAQLDGKTVTVTSAFRTRDEQIAARVRNCGNTNHDIYHKRASECRPPTAIPGTSKHETGEAVDLGGDREYVANLLKPFGVGRPVSGEPWHFEYVGGNEGGDINKLNNAMIREGIDFNTRNEIFLGREPQNFEIFRDQAGNLDIPLVPDSIESAFGAIDDVARALVDPTFWKRVGLGAGGVALLVGGVVIIARDQLTGAVGNIAKEVLS